MGALAVTPTPTTATIQKTTTTGPTYVTTTIPTITTTLTPTTTVPAESPQMTILNLIEIVRRLLGI